MVAATDTRTLTGDIVATIELFASWGVAIFPGPYGEKGTRETGWPHIDPQVARDLTLEGLRRHPVNIAARTGPELGVIDVDGKNGVPPEEALRSLLAALPKGIAVSKTFRGFGIFFRPVRVVGDGLLPAYGAELFTGGHLVNVPPSRHPEGVDYEWVIPPGGELPEVDLEALGLVPQGPLGAAPPNGHRRDGPLEPSSAEVQDEFRQLMASVGVQPRGGGQELLYCAWHDDRHTQTAGRPRPSLSVNWSAAAFHCLTTSCGVGGRIGSLRRLLGVKGQPCRPGPRVPPSQVPSQTRPRDSLPAIEHGARIDPEFERSRLVQAMKESGVAWPFDRTTGRARWEQIVECHVAQVKYECVASGHRVAYPFSCGVGLCPKCMPARLRKDFRRHLEHLPTRLALFLIAPPEGIADRSEVSSWFRGWRRTSDLFAGFYGVRLRVGRPDVLLVLPADQVPAGIVSDRCATLVAADVPLEEAVAWYVEMFLDEISSWRTPEEMLTLLAAVKGRRRFQGFGKYYASRAATREVEDEELFTGEPKKLHRASGGSAKGGNKAVACPICGSRMRAVGIAPNAEGMAWDAKYNCYRWGTGPPPTASGNGRAIATGVMA